MRCDATTSRRGEQEAEVLADKRQRCNERASMDAMLAGSNNNDKSSGGQSKNHFKGSAEGGLREVTHEFGGQPLCGGRDRALDTVAVAPLSHFFWFVV